MIKFRCCEMGAGSGNFQRELLGGSAIEFLGGSAGGVALRGVNTYSSCV